MKSKKVPKDQSSKLEEGQFVSDLQHTDDLQLVIFKNRLHRARSRMQKVSQNSQQIQELKDKIEKSRLAGDPSANFEIADTAMRDLEFQL